MSRPDTPAGPGGPSGGATLRRSESVVVATGEDPGAHRRACRAALDPESTPYLRVRTTGEHTAPTDAATTIRYAPGDDPTGPLPGTRRASSGDDRHARSAAGLAVAITNAVGTRGDGDPVDCCVDSPLPIREHAGDELFWVLRTLALAPDGADWSCHVHLPVAPSASLPPAVAESADARVALPAAGATARVTGRRRTDPLRHWAPRATGGSLPSGGRAVPVRLPVPLFPRRVRVGAALLVAAAICYFSLLDAPPAQPPSGGGGLLPGLSPLHIVAYAALAGALAYATVELADRPLRRVVLVVRLAVGYGIAIELLQAPLPERYYSETDMVANALGAVLALPWVAVERLARYVPVMSAG